MLSSKPFCFLAVVFAVAACFMAAPASYARGLIYRVTAFGAKGDGSTDDTVAIERAIAAARPGSGNTVLFPAGNYLYSRALHVNGITLRGQNASLVSETTLAYVRLEGSGAAVLDLRFSKNLDLIIPVYTLVVDGATNFTISRIVTGLGDSATVRKFSIFVDHSSNGTISGNNLVTPGGIYLHYANNVSIIGNTIRGARLIGPVPPEPEYLGVLSQHCRALKITGNTITSFGPDRGSDFASEGIAEESDKNCSISGNTITKYSTAIVERESTDCVLQRNNITSHPTIFTLSAIDLYKSGNMIVQQNNINQAGKDGIRCESCFQQLTISENSLNDCGQVIGASAAVIYNDSPAANPILIEKNRYTGDTFGLNYFIECLQPSPPVFVSGNITNTLLVNRIGP